MSVQLSPFRLEATELALSNILSLHEPVDLSLHKLFRSLPKLGVQDRFFVAENCYTILRFLRRLEWICQDNITPRRIFLANLLYYQGFSIREISSHIHSKETKWLEYSRNLTLPATNPALTLNLPDWLYIKLSQIFEPEELTQLAYSLNSPASLDLRVNSLLGRRPEILSRLQNKNIASALTPYAPLGLRLDNKMDLVHLDLFKEGIIEVQDEGSQLICQLMEAKRHERIADFCAGAGGKSLALSADMKSSGQIYAFDISEKRLAKMRPRLRRSTSTNIQPIRIESEHDPKLERYQARMDRVLVDAPCSGLGTLRRNPELKWRQSPDTIARLVQQQSSILHAAAQMVKPGGRLVYATCSLLKEENHHQVEAFLAKNSEFKLISAQKILQRQHIDLDTGPMLELWPHQHHTDGFFGAVMERIRHA